MNQQDIPQKVDIILGDLNRIDRSFKFAADIEKATAKAKPKNFTEEILLLSAHFIALAAVAGSVMIGVENASRLAENRQLAVVNL